MKIYSPIATTAIVSVSLLAAACGAGSQENSSSSEEAAALSESKTNCSAPQTTAEMIFCANEEFKLADAELNARWPAVKNHYSQVDKDIASTIGLPAGAPSSLSLIVKAQQSWIQFRDNECKARTAIWSNGSFRPVAVISCRTDLTRIRTTEFKTVLLEPAANLDPRAESEFLRIEKSLSACKDKGSTVTANFCLGKIYEASDKLLNAQYQSVKSVWQKDMTADDVNALVDSELAWISMRDSECSARVRSSLGGTGFSGFLSTCNAGKTILRTAELKAFLAERNR